MEQWLRLMLRWEPQYRGRKPGSSGERDHCYTLLDNILSFPVSHHCCLLSAKDNLMECLNMQLCLFNVFYFKHFHNVASIACNTMNLYKKCSTKTSINYLLENLSCLLNKYCLFELVPLVHCLYVIK